jgi:hypothetical protein
MKIPFSKKSMTSYAGNLPVTVTFSRGFDRHPRLGKYRTTTHCMIETADGTKAEGIAYKNPYDYFDETEGRERALQKATSLLPRHAMLNVRKAAWKAYLVDTGILKPPAEETTAAAA